MPILGAHMSIAGGYYKAVEAAKEHGCQCVQVFTKNNNQWRAKPITPDEATKFRQRLQDLGITHPLSHDCYLINLAAPDDGLWKKSIDAYVVELQRAEMLGIPYVNMHPGAFTSTSEQQGLKRIIKAFDEVHRQTRGLKTQTLLENTAGQGTSLGWRFEHLATILAGVKDPDRMGGVCIDTCHTLAAGYPLTARADYLRTMRELDAIVGLKFVKAFHVNDSKTPLGSRVDRHAHIGRGHLGLEAFRHLLNDPRFRKVPMYLETRKGVENGVDLDEMNLATLRSLVGKSSSRASISKPAALPPGVGGSSARRQSRRLG